MKIFVGAFVLAVGLLVGLYSVASALPSSAPTDVEQARAAFELSIRVRGEAARDFNAMQRFPAVFVDDASVPLTEQQRSTVSRLAPGVASKGFLTFNEVYFLHWQQGAAAFKRVTAAKARGDIPAIADVQSAIPPRTDPLVMPRIDYKSTTIGGDRAAIEADTEGILYRVTMIRVNGQWKVAGENNLVHN